MRWCTACEDGMLVSVVEMMAGKRICGAPHVLNVGLQGKEKVIDNEL